MDGYISCWLRILKYHLGYPALEPGESRIYHVEHDAQYTLKRDDRNGMHYKQVKGMNLEVKSPRIVRHRQLQKPASRSDSEAAARPKGTAEQLWWTVSLSDPRMQ